MTIRNLLATMGASGLAILLIVGAIFANKGLSYEIEKERPALQVINPGGRLHIDSNLLGISVYVENFNSHTDGIQIYARVRLSEYMEIGEGATEVEGLTLYMSSHGTLNGVSAIREYFQINTGGRSSYIPTFNKNKDSHRTDVKGKVSDTGQEQNGYNQIMLELMNKQVTDIATYDMDEDHQEELNPTVETRNMPILDPDIYQMEETHYLEYTGSAIVITMAEWKVLPADQQSGNYWVYDTDGWAYWAQAILPGKATGLLINGVSIVEELPIHWYYQISGEGEYATAGDWGDPEEGTGFYIQGITEDALALLKNVSGRDN